MSRVRSLRSENHIRVLALNNQLTIWKHTSNEDNDHMDTYQQKISSNGFHSVQTIDEVDETSEKIPTTKLIQPQQKFKSKLPFSPKSYRKNFNQQ